MKLDIDFAFEGFRIIRQRPLLIVVWGIFMLVVSAASTFAMMYFAGPSIEALNALQSSPTDDPAVVMAALQNMLPIYAIAMPVGLLMQAVMSSAVYRCVLGDKNSAFGFLRFGGAELRQVALYFLFFLTIIGVFIGALLAGALIGLVLSTVLGRFGVLAGVLLAYGLVFWLMIRLSLAPVQTFDQKKVNLFGSWQLTKGNTWTLFFGYLVMLVMVLLVGLLCMAVFAAVAVGAYGGNFSAVSSLFDGSMPTQDDFTNPVYIGYILISNLLVSPLVMALMLGAPAAAYKQITGAGR